MSTTQGETGDSGRSPILCLVVGELSGRALARVTERLAEQGIEVVVEHRHRTRRRGPDRRHGEGDGGPVPQAEDELRRINSQSGRRVVDRRAPQAGGAAEALELHSMLSRRERKALSFVRPNSMQESETRAVTLTRRALAAQVGGVRAMERLIAESFDYLYSRFLAATDDHHEAEDLTQKTVTNVWLAIGDYEFRRGVYFTAWLRTIARNVIVTEARRPTLDTEPFDLAVHDREAAPESRLLLAEPGTSVAWISDADIQSGVRRLPETQRRVLALRFLFDFAPEEIARQLDTTPGAVADIEYRAKRALRTRLTAVEERGLRSRRLWSLRRMPPAPVMAARRFALAR